MTSGRSSRRRSLVAMACLALLTGLCSVTSAQTPRIGLLSLETEDLQDDALAPRLTQELREQLAKRDDLTLVDTRVSLHQLSVGQNCNPSEASCLQKVADNLKVDGLLFGKVTREGGVPIAVTRRYDRKANSVQSWAIVSFESSTVTDAQLKEQTQTLVTTLLGPAQANPEAKVADASQEPAPALQPPAEQPESQESSAIAESLHEKRSLSHGMSLRTIAGIALIGGAAASVGLSIFSFTQVNSAQHNASYEAYRMAVGQMNASVKDVCNEADAGKRYGLSPDGFKDVKHSCSNGQTFEILQYVFIGSAILTGGLATYLLVGGGKPDTQPSSEATSRLSFHPALARGGASLTARLRF